MQMKKSLLAGGLLSLGLLLAGAARADDLLYRLTITNLTPGQPLAPVMAATHRPGFAFFSVGQAPSHDLAMLAEAGNGQPLAQSLRQLDVVDDARLSQTGLTFPGHSTTVTVMAKRGDDHVSVAAMLGATNDAFFALKDAALPQGAHKVVYTANAYDAGSETNDELAATVAGLGGEGYSPNDNGEGFIHIHSGVHGIGDLVPAIHDWRNPVVRIVIERIGDD